jgi:hypothetical protein
LNGLTPKVLDPKVIPKDHADQHTDKVEDQHIGKGPQFVNVLRIGTIQGLSLMFVERTTAI